MEADMTARHRPQPIDPIAVQTQAEATARKRRHIFRWVFLAIQVLFLVWIIAGAASSSSASCAGLKGAALHTCHDAGHVGTAIGVGLIIFLWAAVDLILGVGYLVFGRRGR
jgi:hypothetical protein